MKDVLSVLEKAVLVKLLEGDIPLLIQLRQQLAGCAVTKREFTGFGFYTTLVVSEDIPRTTDLDIKFGDVVGDIPELRSGAGFLLYVKNGVLDMLEGYSYDERWPSSIRTFSLKYLKGERRDWSGLERSLRRSRS